MPRILVVDDEPLISMLMEDWLVELGCEVVGPARSVQGRAGPGRKCRSGRRHPRLTPERRQILRCRAALRERGVPFAFATGDGQIDASAGFPNPILLSKPFDFDAVKNVVGKLLKPAARSA